MPTRLAIHGHRSVHDVERCDRGANDPVARSHWHILWLLAPGRASEQRAAVTGSCVQGSRTLARRDTQNGALGLGARRHHHPGATGLFCAAQRTALAQPPAGASPAPHRGGPASRSGGLPRRLRASALRPHVLAAAAHDRPGGLHGGPARRCPGRGSRAGPAGALRPRWRRGACAPAAPQARGGAAAPLTAVCARAPAGRARGALDERPLAHRHVRHLDAWQKGQGPGWLARPARPAGIRAQTTFHGWPQTAYTAINHPDLV